MADSTTDDFGGASLNDLVSTKKGGAQTLAVVAQALMNAFPKSTASTSPVVTGNNSISATATTIIPANAARHGIIFHNPGTTTIFVYPTALATAPTTTVPGGSFAIAAGSTLSFAPSAFPNVNGGWSAFCTTGSTQALTIAEFY